MNAADSNTPTPTTEWWENVNLADAAASTKTVEDFIVTDKGRMDEGQFLEALPLMIMCGGDDPPWLADQIAKGTKVVVENAKLIPEREEAKAILQKRVLLLESLGDALARLPDSFKGDPKDPTSELYKDASVARVYEAVQTGIASCSHAIEARGPGFRIRLRPTPPPES